MNTHNKIDFRPQALTHGQLTQRIQHWLQTMDLETLYHRLHFKYFPRFVTALPSLFLTHSLLYTIQKRFPSLITPPSQPDLLHLSENLKQHYTLITMATVMKQDHHFHFLCVYLTKLIRAFMLDNFSDIDVTLSMQAELYLILVHVMIGIQVSVGSYHIYHKKIINQKLYHLQKNNHFIKTQSAAQTVVSKASTNRITYLKNKKKHKNCLERHASPLQCKEDPISIDQFRDTLRQNLNVKILPKLPKKKLKAQDFDQNAIKQHTQKQNDQNRYLLTIKPAQFIKPRQSYLKSNQNSTSFEILFAQANQKTCFVHRDVKISHRPQLFLTRTQKHTKTTLTTTPNSPSHRKDKLEDNLTHKNWNNIVQDIKYHTLHTNKLQEHINQKHSNPSPQKQRKSTEIQPIPSGRRYTTTTTPENTKIQLQQLAFIKKQNNFGYNQLILQQQQSRQNSPSQHQQTRLLKSHKLRIQRQRFDIYCQKRNKDTHYSMFNLMITPSLSFNK